MFVLTKKKKTRINKIIIIIRISTKRATNKAIRLILWLPPVQIPLPPLGCVAYSALSSSSFNNNVLFGTGQTLASSISPAKLLFRSDQRVTRRGRRCQSFRKPAHPIARRLIGRRRARRPCVYYESLCTALPCMERERPLSDAVIESGV